MQSAQSVIEIYLEKLRKFHENRKKSERLLNKLNDLAFISGSILILMLLILFLLPAYTIDNNINQNYLLKLYTIVTEQLSFRDNLTKLILISAMSLVILSVAIIKIKQKILKEETNLTKNLQKLLPVHTMVRLSLFESLSQSREAKEIFQRFVELEKMLENAEECGREVERKKIQEHLKVESEKLKELERNVGPRTYTVQKIINSGCIRITDINGILTVVSLYDEPNLNLEIVK